MHDLGDRGRPPFGIRLDQKDTGKPVRVNPGIPIVDGMLAGMEPHPPEVVAGQTWIQNPSPDFIPDAASNQRGDRIQTLSQQV